MLDIGCNDGMKTVERFSSEAVSRVLGLEYNEKLATKAQQSYGNEKYKSWAEWLEGNYKTLKRLILQKKSTISMGIKMLTCTKGSE